MSNGSNSTNSAKGVNGSDFLFFIMVLSVILFLFFLIVSQEQRFFQPLRFGCMWKRWGCCPDNLTTRLDQNGSNCVPRPYPHHHSRPHYLHPVQPIRPPHSVPLHPGQQPQRS